MSFALLVAGQRTRAALWPLALGVLLVIAAVGIVRRKPAAPAVWWLFVTSCAAMVAHVALNCGVLVDVVHPDVRARLVGPLVVVMTATAGFAGARVAHPLLRSPATRTPAALALVLFLGTTLVVQSGAEAGTEWDLRAPGRISAALFVLCAVGMAAACSTAGRSLRRIGRFADCALIVAPVPSGLGYGIAQLAGSSGALAGGSWLGPLWSVALVAVAASQPSMRVVATPLDGDAEATSSLRRLPAVASTVLLLTPLMEGAARISLDHRWVSRVAGAVVVAQAVVLVALLERPRVLRRRSVPAPPAAPTLGDELRLAVARGELSMHYQAVYRAGDGALAGAEALARWSHPRLGLLSAAEFLPAADDDTAEALDRWALRCVLRDATAVLACATVDEPYLAVNLSPRRAERADLVAMVDAELEAAGVSPDGLVVELTETEAVSDWSLLRDNLAALQDRGFWVAVDDFGAGHANLLHLTRLDPDIVKVDRELVEAAAASPRGRQLLRGSVAVAKGAGALVVAEGVVDPSWVPELAAMGVDYVQGFVLGRPCALAAFSAGGARSAALDRLVEPDARLVS